MRQSKLTRQQRARLRCEEGARVAQALLARLDERAALDPRKAKPRRRSWIGTFLAAGALTKVGAR